MKNSTLLPVLVAGLSIASAASFAQSSDTSPNYGPFVGAGLGYYRLNDNDFLNDNDRLKDNQTARRVFAGYEFDRMISVEGGFIDFGRTEDGFATMDADGWTLALLAAFPINDLVAPYGKVGVLKWDAERQFGGLRGRSDGNDLFYGFGARFTLVHHLDLQLGYERFKMDSTDLDMVAANIVFRF